MTSRRIFTIQELDERLRPAAQEPELFEALAASTLTELDNTQADLEIADPLTWRKSHSGSGANHGDFLNLFRADVDSILTLDREQEADLARRIEFARLRLEQARKRAGRKGDDLFEAIRRHEGPRKETLPRDLVRRTEELHALRTEMVERNLYLVLINVERYVQDAANRVDLIQEGSASLFRAVDGFDWRRGLLFRTYAVHWLNQAFRNFIYNFRSTVRVPVYLQKAMKHITQAQIRLGDAKASPAEIAETTDLTESLVSAAKSAAKSTYSMDGNAGAGDDDGNRLRDLLAEDENPEGLYLPDMENVSLEEGLAEAMKHLSDRERKVVCMRFGIGLPAEHTLAEVAADLGVSVERVRQIQVRAIAKMNTPGLRRDLEPFLSN